jgi:hypothetical protein
MNTAILKPVGSFKGDFVPIDCGEFAGDAAAGRTRWDAMKRWAA